MTREERQRQLARRILRVWWMSRKIIDASMNTPSIEPAAKLYRTELVRKKLVQWIAAIENGQ